MSDRYPEVECYQCGRMKTALSYRSRCLTCETQRADANADENDELRARLAAAEADAERWRPIETAPRITPEHIEEAIYSEHYFTAANGVAGATGSSHALEHGPLDLLTFCVLVLRNGFTVTGESACASPENFDAQLGRKIARNKARDKIWALEGYLLKERLYGPATD